MDAEAPEAEPGGPDPIGLRATAFQLAGLGAILGLVAITIAVSESGRASSAAGGPTPRSSVAVAAGYLSIPRDTDTLRHLRTPNQRTPLPHDSIVARRAAAALARRHGADSIKSHSAPPEAAAVP